MKILVISHMYPSPVNPVYGIYIHQQVKALQTKGCDIKVVSPVPLAPFPFNKIKKWSKYSEVPTRAVIDGIEVYYPRYIEFPKGYLHTYTGQLMYRGIRKTVFELFEKHEFDMIHSHVAYPDGYAAMLCNKRLHVPHITTIHGQDLQVTIFRDEKSKKNVFKVLKNVESIITVSNKLKNVVRNEDFYSKIQAINNGIDVESSVYNASKVNEGVSKKNINIISVSNLVPAKGIDINLRAVAELIKKYPDIEYTIIGEGSEKARLIALASELGISDKVVFTGRLNYDQVMQYMSRCDIFSLPSWREGFGVVYIEAMLHGKPVIGIKGEGIEDAIEDGDNGFLAKPKDVPDLIRIIDFILQNPQKVERVAENGRRSVLEHFTWEQNAEKTLKVYNELLSKSH